MLENGFVTLDRKLLSWRWYTEPNTMRLFLHLLMTANYSDHEYLDLTVKRGQRVTSYSVLAEELKMSVQSIRTALKNLEKTGDLTRSKHSKFTVVTLNNYDAFLLPTGDQQSANNYGINNNNKNKNNKAKKSGSAGSGGSKYEIFTNVF